MRHYDYGFAKPEMIIGLAGPIGTDLKGVASKISGDLRSYNYKTDVVRVSDLLQNFCTPLLLKEIEGLSEERRIDTLMNAGDHLRCKISSGAAIIPAVVEDIRRRRQNFLLTGGCKTDFEKVELYNRCFIINSLKHPDEVDLLRHIYGDKFVLLSVVAAQEVRKSNLVSKIAKSHQSTENKQYRDLADQLIEKDRQRIDTRFGQSIGATFPLADFFMRSDIDQDGDISRFLKIIFGDQRETPTRLEFAMYEARSNAYRSADLSRQVGAVVTTKNLEIVSRGCNEVPTPGGGVFWAGDQGRKRDNRDISEGRDFNSVKKVEILTELLSFLGEKNIASFGNKDIEETVDQLVFDGSKDGFKHLRISNLIEFGRMVHAEMGALMEAARRGLPVAGGKLVCTTFPCHMCARHIISAGIQEVYFIEPYPKSMTEEMYSDEIEIESGGSEIGCQKSTSKVYFSSFFGVAPRFFDAAFEMRRRKDKQGYTINFERWTAIPPMIPLSRSHLSVELVVGQTAKFIPQIDKISDIESDLE